MCVRLLQFVKSLFEAQKGYTSDIVSTPTRIFELREVIADLDDAISQVVE
jgi:hypothetical protein